MSDPIKDPILSLEFNLPREVSEVKGKDPGTWLQFNTHMVTRMAS